MYKHDNRQTYIVTISQYQFSINLFVWNQEKNIVVYNSLSWTLYFSG